MMNGHQTTDEKTYRKSDRTSAERNTVTQLETLISKFCRVVSEYLLFAEEWERSAQRDIVLLPHRNANKVRSLPGNRAPKVTDYAVLMAKTAASIDELGMQIVHCLADRELDTKELRRFLRAVELWQPEEASSLWWNDVELDLQDIALRLKHGTGKKPAVHAADEAPAEITKKKTKRRKRGRPFDTDVKQDRRLYEAWQTGQYRSKQELADAFHLSKKEVVKAIDRERKRPDDPLE